LVVVAHLVRQLVQLLLMQTGPHNQHHRQLAEMEQQLHLEASLRTVAAAEAEVIVLTVLRVVLVAVLVITERAVPLAAMRPHLVGQVLETSVPMVLTVAVAVLAVRGLLPGVALVSLCLEIVSQVAAEVGENSVPKIV
jgi:hypothetical protein